MEKSEILKELKKAPYGFIANNYYNLSKEELKDIALELICIVDDDDDYRNKLVRNLIDMKGWDDGDTWDNDLKENESKATNTQWDSKREELKPCYDGAKSFYKNAYIVKHYENHVNAKGEILQQTLSKIDLYSYDTLVLTIYDGASENGDKYFLYASLTNSALKRGELFDDTYYTHTTMRHVRECLKQFYWNNTKSPLFEMGNYSKKLIIEQRDGEWVKL